MPSPSPITGASRPANDPLHPLRFGGHDGRFVRHRCDPAQHLRQSAVFLVNHADRPARLFLILARGALYVVDRMERAEQAFGLQRLCVQLTRVGDFQPLGHQLHLLHDEHCRVPRALRRCIEQQFLGVHFVAGGAVYDPEFSVLGQSYRYFFDHFFCVFSGL